VDVVHKELLCVEKYVLDKSRFNLHLLRSLRNVQQSGNGSPSIPKFSRRTFIGLSAASAAYGAIPPFLFGEGFSIIPERDRLHLAINNEPRWTIDARIFGPEAKLHLVRRHEKVAISLLNGRFPGSNLPADFECLLDKRLGTWLLNIKFTCGIQTQAELLPWLRSENSATGISHSLHFRACPGFSVLFSRRPEASFSRDWTFELTAPASIAVDGIGAPLSAAQVSVALSPSGQIAGESAGPATIVSIPRGTASWAIDLRRNSEKGWSIDHSDRDSIFDELRVETTASSHAQLQSALLLQRSASPNTLRFFTGGGFLSDSGEPFHLVLQNPRLAFALNEENMKSALLADLEPKSVWAHASGLSFLFKKSADDPGFELFEEKDEFPPPKISPEICEICFPSDDTCTNLKFGVPRPVPFTWADVAAPFEWILGVLHLLPSQHNFNILLQDGDRLQIDRPRDLLSLGFKFHDMHLVTGADPHLVPNGKHSKPRITVIFPPQHIAEEAFFHTDGDVPNVSPFAMDVPIDVVEYRNYYNDPNANPSATQLADFKKLLDPDMDPTTPNNNNNTQKEFQAQTRLAGESRLVFALDPKSNHRISFNLTSLLDWTNWTPVVADVAKHGVAPQTQSDIPLIRNPADATNSEPVGFTSIELPYRLNLSPSDIGGWAHSLVPASYGSSNVELWHTRLGVLSKLPIDPQKSVDSKGNSRSFIDESNVKDRTVRAIWSPDYVAGDGQPCSQTQPPDTFPLHFSDKNAHNSTPFRTSLDDLDRCELVHLTSNYALKKREYFCTDNSNFPLTLLNPLSVNVERMMLTSMGGYLTSLGAWDPVAVDLRHILTVQQWRQISTLGRDQYVRVVYKGFLLPFGHAASLVKVTERLFEPTDMGYVAVLHQRMYIVVQNPVKQCRVLGEANSGRGFNFSSIEALTLVTPYIDPPQGPWPSNNAKQQTQSLFWPCVGGKPFNFRFRFFDAAHATSEASMPVVFADASVAQREGTVSGGKFGSTDAISLYNGGSGSQTIGSDDSRTTASFFDQKVAFAESIKPGDTQYDASIIGWRVDPLPAVLSGLITQIVNGAPQPIPGATVTLTDVNSGTVVTTANGDDGTYSFPFLAPGNFSIQAEAAGFTTFMSNSPFRLGGHDKGTINLILSAGSGSQSGPITPTIVSSGTTALDLYRHDLPYFYPAVDYARITSSSIKRVTGNTNPTRVIFYPGYLASGFDRKKNRGEVILQIEDQNQLDLAFGGAQKNVDKAGGLASPDTTVVGFSRSSGPIGGRYTAPDSAHAAMRVTRANPKGTATSTSLSTFSTGNFNPADFFGGLTSAKILGAIKLSDIIASLAPGLASNLDKAPKMLEQSVFTIEDALNDVVGAIKAFQGLTDPLNNNNVNIIAQHLAPNAQLIYDAQAKAAAAHAQTVGESDSIAQAADAISEGLLDGELVMAILQYAGALETLLKNPGALAQEEIVDVLSSLIGPVLANLVGYFNNLSNELNQNLDSALATALAAIGALTDAASAQLDDIIYQLAQEYDTALDKLSDQLTPAKKTFSDLAPELEAISDLVNIAQDLRTRVNDFITAAGSISIPTFTTVVPALLNNLSSILDDLLQIYQRVGFLGLVTVDQNLVSGVLQAESNVSNLWLSVDYLSDTANKAITDALNSLAEDYMKLAASEEATVGKQILQNVRQLQRAAQSLTTYAKAIQALTNRGALDKKELRRQVQLVQQLQSQVLSALAALQTIAKQPDANGAPNPALAVLTADVTAIVPLLTIADKLTGPNPIEGLTAAIAADPALAAHAAELKSQLSDLRQQLASDADNVALKLQHYALSLEYQASYAAVVAWDAYGQDAVLKAALQGLKAFNTLATAVQTFTTAIATVICFLSNDWNTFTTNLNTSATGNFISSLFVDSLQGVTNAFAGFNCPTPPPNPSIILHQTHAVISAFNALIADVRSRVNNVATIADYYLNHAQNLLPTLLNSLPLPTSVTLSYDWHPDIQSCEPVFVLGPDADFTVSAKATISLALGGDQPSIQPSFNIDATLTDFSINLIGSPSFVIVKVKSLEFASQGGNSPNCHLVLDSVTFGDAMQFVEELAKALDPSEGPFIELADASLRAGFRFSVPSITMGAFNLMQLAIEVAVSLPFDGDPVRCEFGLSTQEHPFLLSAGIFGGGGFLQLQLGLDGVQLLQGALEFGVVAAISIGPLQGEGFVVAGIYFRISGSSSMVCGFVHAHGHMDIFGIVSLDVDLYVATCYDSSTGTVRGTATFTVQVSVLFFSESYTLSAEYTFAGSSSGSSNARAQALPDAGAKARVPATDGCSSQQSPEPPPLFIEQKDWTEYYNAFAA
jgi:hypothetical protein